MGRRNKGRNHQAGANACKICGRVSKTEVSNGICTTCEKKK